MGKSHMKSFINSKKNYKIDVVDNKKFLCKLWTLKSPNFITSSLISESSVNFSANFLALSLLFQITDFTFPKIGKVFFLIVFTSR